MSSNPSTSLRVTGIEVYNVYGEKVYSSVVSGQLSVVQQQTTNNEQRPTNIDLSSQPSGIYFLQVKTNYGTINMEHPTWRKKLILNK